MGEVHRARDSKLNRDVAIKVLPAALSNDADYMARFQREAQVLAALNHPNIAAIIANSGEGSPHFGPNGTVWFRYSDGKANFVGLMKKDGTSRHQVTTRPVSTVMSSSPDGHWAVAMAPAPNSSAIDTIAIPADGGTPRTIASGRYPVVWARDGKFVYVPWWSKQSQTVAIPVSSGELSELPSSSGLLRTCSRRICPNPGPSFQAGEATQTEIVGGFSLEKCREGTRPVPIGAVTV